MALKIKLKYTAVVLASFLAGLIFQILGFYGASFLMASIIPTILYWSEYKDEFQDRKTKYKFYAGLGAIAITLLLLIFLQMLTFSF